MSVAVPIGTSLPLPSCCAEKHGHGVVPFTAANANNEPSEWERYFPRGADFERPGAGDLLRFLYSHDASLNQSNVC